MIKFHIFFALGKSASLTYAYDVTWRAIVNSILKDPPREKHKCPALVLNRFNTINGSIRNQYILLKQTTGYYGIDIDDVDSINFVKRQLFEFVPELKIVWTSHSGRGIKAIGYNPILKNLNPEEYKARYKLVCNSIKQQCGIRIHFDLAQGRCHQPVFLNNDPNAYTR